MKRAGENKYTIELSKLKNGLHVFDFDIGSDFFSHFEYSTVDIGEVKVQARIQKYETHLDAKFGLEGYIMLECDRCTEPYKHMFSSEHRVIYAYDPKMHNDQEEVVFIEKGAPTLDLSRDFYDFISLEVPIRKVPDKKVHQCAPEILALISPTPGGEEDKEEDDDDLDDEEWDDEEDTEEDTEEDDEEEEEVVTEEDFEEDEDWDKVEDKDDDLDEDFEEEEEDDDAEIF